MLLVMQWSQRGSTRMAAGQTGGAHPQGSGGRSYRADSRRSEGTGTTAAVV